MHEVSLSATRLAADAQPELDEKRREMLCDAEKLARIGSFEWNIPANEITWSDGLYAIYGLTPGEFQASFEGFLAQLHPDDRERVRATIEKASRTGRPFSIEERIVRRDGSVRNLRSKGEVIKDATGAAVRILGVCQDITESKQAEELTAAWNETLEQRVRERTRQLEDANARLAEALEQLGLMQQQMVSQARMVAVGNLVAGVAHEINTPLGAVKGAVDVMARCIPRVAQAFEQPDGSTADGDTKLASYLETLRENSRTATEAGNRLSEIVERLERLSRQNETRAARLDLNDTLDGILALTRHHTVDRIRIIRNYGELPSIWCDAGQVGHALTNLLLNAYQAIEGAGDVSLATWSDGPSVFVQIRDSGRGISPEKLESLFEIGFTTRSAKVRLGTGLFITKNVVQKHGGNLSVESELGRGATFTVRLPTQPAPVI